MWGMFATDVQRRDISSFAFVFNNYINGNNSNDDKRKMKTVSTRTTNIYIYSDISIS